MVDYLNNKELASKESTFSNPILTVITLVTTILLGIGLTSTIVLHFLKMDNAQIKAHVNEGALTLSLYAPQEFFLQTFVEVNKKLHAVQTAINNNDNTSIQTILDAQLWKLPPQSLETTTLEFIPKITFNELNELSTRFHLDENSQLTVVEKSTSGQLIPAREKEEYYPVLFEASFDQPMAIIGLDRATDPGFILLMQQARDTGLIASLASFPSSLEDNYVFTYYYLPLYKPNTQNATIQQRRNNHIGFVAAVTYQAAEQALLFLPSDIRGTKNVFFPLTEAYDETNLDKDIASLLKNKDMIEVIYQMENESFVIVSQANNDLLMSMDTDKNNWAILIGSILTALICSMILWSRRQSNKIIKLVKERTHDLVERTDSLAQANNALSESEARYRMLADNASDVIYTHDMNGICTYISPSIKQQNGFDIEDYIGFPITSHLSSDSAESLNNMLKEAVKNFHEEPGSRFDNHTFEFEIYCKDKTVKPVENTMSFILDEFGEPIGVLGVSRDISERKKAEQEREALEDIYQQSQKMEAIGTLAGGIAHDFNNLLTGILGYSDLLKIQVKNNPEAEDSINVIEKSAIRAKDLTSQLLGFARKGQYQAAPVDINEVLVDIIKLIERTIDKKIKISQFLSEKAAVVNGDLGQLTQLFLNLAVNAKDAMPDGGRLTFESKIVNLDNDFSRTHLDMKAGKYNLIMVSDTGIGISDEKIDRIFEPFFTDKNNGEGTGMGLAMVYGVTKNHGGVVTVYSAEEVGTTFKVYLPYSEENIQENKQDNADQLVEGAGNILIVDDEEMIRDMAKTMLMRLGYSISTAEDGERAVQFYKDNWKTIDLVIVDMIMPNMGGIECMHALNKINPHVKVIISTGYSLDAMSEKLNDEHIFGFLQKPFKLQELSEVVSKVLN